MDITYIILQKKINQLKKELKHIILGHTTLGHEIVCFVLEGNTTQNIIIQGGMHAREYITSFLILEQIEFLKNIKLNNNFYFVPLSNPDGVQICLLGYNSVKDKRLQQLYKNFDVPYTKYKANAIGVDINTNFDAYWSCGKSNVFRPNSQNFVGYGPESELETQALVKLTNKLKPTITISYHSKGNVVYYGFCQKGKQLKRQKIFAQRLNTGYKLQKTKKSCGGYKDYNIYKFNNLSYTIEVGDDNLVHPIGIEYLNDIISNNIFTPLLCDKF